MVTVLAYDLGASNGRLTAQYFDGSTVALKEIYRFSNEALQKGKHFYWDYEQLVKELHRGLELAAPFQGSSLGIDTWGVDFGCVNKANQLLQNPFSYRDMYSAPYVEKIQQSINHYELYCRTGNEISSINTIFQLMAMAEQYGDVLTETEHALLMPSLLLHALSGEKVNEYTIASTTQLVNLQSKDWDQALIKKVFNKSLPLSPIGTTHEVVGKLVNAPTIQMVLVPGHDTACALSALPIDEQHSIFVSLGTWGLIGMELDTPVISLEAFEHGFTNEGTSEKTIRFQKNATGFWILQRLRKEWQQQETITFAQEAQAFHQTLAFQAIINPEAEAFFNPPSMQQAIRDFCQQTNQRIPESFGDYIRCFSESLALYYAVVIQKIEEITGRQSNAVYIGGGGTQNELLCQLIANACGKRVVAGPVEASSIGNGLSQLRALGEIGSIGEGREVVKASFSVKEYEPQDMALWKAMKEKYYDTF